MCYQPRVSLGRHAAVHTLPTPPAKRQQIRSVRSYPRASQACHACATAKTKCDNGVRCKRCTRKNIPCVRRHPITEASALSDAEPPTVAAQNPSSTGSFAMDPNNFINHPQVLGELDIPASARMYTDPMLLDTPRFYGLPSVNLANGENEPGQSGLDFDFNFDSAYNLFDFGGDHDLGLSEQDHNFLTSLPLQPQDEPDEASPATSLIAGPDQPSSQAVYEAFKQSIGRWEPDRRHYRTTEERDLSLDRTATSKMDCLGDWDPEIISQNLTPSIRDQILKTLIRTCNQDNVIDVISSFPAVEVLDRLLKSYLTRQATTADSWIHVPTFNVGEVRLELLVACLAAAATMSSSRSVQKFGLALQEFLVLYLWLVSEKANTLTRDIHYLQAFAIQLEIGLWSGVRRKMEMSESFSGILSNPLRAAGNFRFSNYPQPTVQVGDEGEILETKWKQWVQKESFKKLVYHMHLYCSRMSLVTFGTSTISYAELSVPVPYSKELWVARSAADWKRVYLQAGGNNEPRPQSFINLLADPIALVSLSDLYDRYHIKLCLLHAISDMISRHRQDRSIFAPIEKSGTRVSSFSDEVQHQRILHILKHIRLSYEDLEAQQTIELDLLFHLFSMHLFAPFDQMELAAGKEGPSEARRADPVLQQWIQTGDARQAVWHGSQVLRATRMLAPEQFKHYYVVAAYHSGLCLWIYGMLSQQSKSQNMQNITPGPESSSEDVILDQEESIKTQRWISHNRGRPAISSQSGGPDGNYATKSVPIHSSQLLITTLLQGVLSRFAWKNSLFVENICQLMEALRNMSQRAGERR
ncbi:hypothetical protein CLAIMM_08438 [Cladophialophora immunda]|nr:hypothetical protein CLAIMM_08438 [Cladophialophora immunda]